MMSKNLTEAAEDADFITRVEAKALIDAHQAGSLILVDTRPDELLDEVPTDSNDVEPTIRTYRFGTLDPMKADDQ